MRKIILTSLNNEIFGIHSLFDYESMFIRLMKLNYSFPLIILQNLMKMKSKQTYIFKTNFEETEVLNSSQIFICE